MRADLMSWLRCPSCGAEASFSLEAHERDAREVRAGTLACTACAERYEIIDGIVDLLHDPPEVLRREIAGLARFAEAMRADGWDRERILALPESDHGYWVIQERAMRQILATVAPQAGRRLVDVGSNTCWASNVFAKRGLDVLALDISRVDLQGLRSAEHFLADGAVFFERVVSTMVDPAIATGSVDYVFCCQVLHHNGRKELREAFGAMHRILRSAGVLMVVNEPLRFPLRLKLDHGSEVARFEGNENVYFLHQYCAAARRAGFAVAVPSFAHVRAALTAGTEEVSAQAWLPGLRRALRRHRAGRLTVFLVRLARWTWRYLIRGDANLTLVCTKAPR